MEFGISFDLEPPYDQVFADLIESPRRKHIMGEIEEFVSGLVQQELENQARDAATLNKLNIGLTKTSES